MGTSEKDNLNGFLLIDKPEGITSRNALDIVLRALNTKGGYEGTLDPFASGLLLAGTGTACRFFRYFTELPKTYTAVLQLGTETDTLDKEGSIVKESEVPDISRDDIRQAERKFTGTIDQVPPSFSALKKDGRRGYDLARKGCPVEFEPRSVHIESLAIEPVDRTKLRLLCTVSRGTYIRSLGRDIARSFGTAGHLISLRRLSIGKFTAEEAVLPENISNSHIISADSALYWMDEVSITKEQAEKLINGNGIQLESEPGLYLLKSDNLFLGVGEHRDGTLRPHRLLPQQPGD
jgi:tRNA pseudouridine55 synthase